MSQADYDQVIAGLKKLDTLIEAGKCDSDEAEEIRDELDEPWYAMTVEELKRARKWAAANRANWPEDEK